jgi:hypothetical protein
MSFQLTFLGYYSIKSPQLKKQTHSVNRRNWSHRERTAQADGPRWTAQADSFRWTAIADGLRRTGQPSASIGRPRRTADGLAVRRRTSVGSSDASGRPADAAVDVRTCDNPAHASFIPKSHVVAFLKMPLFFKDSGNPIRFDLTVPVA